MTVGAAPRRVRHLTAHLLGVPLGAALLPGRRVGFAVDPAQAARTLLGGDGARALRARAVLTDTVQPPPESEGIAVHVDRVFFEPQGGLPEHWRALACRELRGFPAAPRPEALAWSPGPSARARLSRFAGYAVATDPRGRLLLTRIAPGFPGAGTWHLPGGATEHGEDLSTGLLRELGEETGQQAQLGSLLGVHSFYREGLPGPGGVSTDIHAVWVLVRAHIGAPRPARVVESAGSTDAAAWFRREELERVELSETARRGLRMLSAG